MKKLLSFFTTLLILSLVQWTQLQAQPRFTIISQTQEVVEGVTHREIIAETSESGTVYPQVIQYLSANPLQDQLHVITGDDYPALSYGMRPLHTMAQAVDNRYPNYRVIGGINGDFYNLNSGIPVEAYVRNGDVVSSGLGNNRPVVGFKDNGDVVFGRPCFEGFEITLFNDAGDIVLQLPVNRINRLPNDLTDVTVYFENFTLPIASQLQKYVIQGHDIKRDAFDTRYFGRGVMVEMTDASIEVPQGHFVVVSNNPYVEGLLEAGTTVRVQEKLGCDFEGVRFAIGAYEHLVAGGNLVDIVFGTAPSARVPRSAVGQKADGSVFFLAVDGRQASDGRTGVTLFELSEIMQTMGAVEAYNLDGGGSTAMVLRNDDTFVYLNQPSDPGGPRSLSNALFFVSGQHQSLPKTLTVPDLSRPLDVPTNIRVQQGQLIWDHVQSNAGYRLNINTQIFNTRSNQFDLSNLNAGRYLIKVETSGEGPYFRDSGFSNELEYIVFPESYKAILEVLRGLGRRR